MAQVVLLDGGMGQELVHRSAEPPSPLWSAAVMQREPGIVEAAHRDFLQAGATAITLNSYSATPERLARHMGGPEADELFETLQRRAVEIAEAARAAEGVDAALLGCLPPLGGSYHPEAGPAFDEALRTYRRIVALQSPHCAVMLAETMSAAGEARASVRAAREAGARAWCALSVDDADGTRLRSGEPLEAGRDAALEEGAEAILLNCSRPEAIARGLPLIEGAGVPFGAYANGFVKADDLAIGGTVDALGVREDLDPAAYTAHAMAWVARGATIVGGCCEVGPAHIARLAAELRAAGHEIVRP
ncbi:homocysteine S-methyltransferase family protein [Jannaschia sp. W003]|uniref:homocysteine S-methyltransferase family protein n=1 Tax=Jannaschia sp. W003 TaxID=2867012 RepID=UPI0021A34F0C|nr:homocysteine S-methyltransferase family protein [Jannaschia sp. W003]UWQ21063.1 homocysteine S-methyltransferase family protein [Jannaschia sp. W003]